MFTSAFRSTKSPKSPVLTRDWRLKKNDAIIWIIKNQFGRRNLTAYVRSILANKLKPLIAAKARERMEEGRNQYSPPKNSWEGSPESVNPTRDTVDIVTEKQSITGDECPVKNSCQTSTSVKGSAPIAIPTPQEKRQQERQNKTNYQIAKIAGVSEDTIRKVEKIEAQASDEVNLQIAQESKDFWNTAAAVGTFRRGDFDNDTGNRRADGAEASTSAPSPQPAAGVINHDTTTSRSYHVSKSRLLEIILS